MNGLQSLFGNAGVDCKSYFDVATFVMSFGWFSLLGHSKMKNLWHGTFYCYFLALPLKRTKSDFITWVTSHCHYMAVKPIHNPFIQCYLTYCQSYVLLESTISTKTSFNLVLHGTRFQHGSVWLLICLIPDYFDTHANSSCTETMVQSVNIDAC